MRKAAWPSNNVREGCPPFLIVYADKDYPFCDVSSEDFCKALKGKKVEAETMKFDDRDHFNEVVKMGKDGDPMAEALCQFVLDHVK